ncbi:MAG TPA: DUF3516 domain-containing protein, partial [Dermatophilaceae bacterium]|nr:DUF3516 domain-containing protein [Dermatophilaceae bacterium]
DQVGMLTGDAAVNRDAPIVCCTAEVLANIALRQGESAEVGQVVMDEFHFYAEPDRGWAWQVPILELPQAQFLLMSATLGEVQRFQADLTRRTGRPTAVVTSATRPVPLSYAYAMTPLHETVEELLSTHQAPVYVVHFTQAAAMEQAQALTSVNVSSREDKDRIAAQIGAFRFGTGFGKTLSRLVRQGIGVHHAGMLPKYRRLVEQLAQAGLLKVICGTDTLGVGINVPIRTVLLTGLTKFDGRRQRVLRAREFHQIAGRAGRAGFDTAGQVVVQAPEHVIENARALAKFADDPRRQRSVRRRQPPEGFVGWSEDTFRRLVAAEPEALVSRMQVSHAMVLNVLARQGDPFPAFRRLLRDNHETGPRQLRLVRRAVQIYRSLLTAGVVERLEAPDADGRVVRVVTELQDDFALNQALSTFALAAFDLLDPASPSYALDVVSVVESTLEDPRQVLWAQQSKARGEAVALMKAQGIEYEERAELVEEVTWPRPLAELLEAAFAAYLAGHPWVAETPVSPKSVARDMFEQAMTFGEFIAHYGLARSEGLVLRYLSDAYKALRQTVPEARKTEEVQDLVEWLGEAVRQTDSSLLDEWELLTSAQGAPLPLHAPPPPSAPRPVTGNERAFRVLVRNAMFRRVELFAGQRFTQLAELGGELDAAGWEAGWAAYRQEHEEVGTGADARGPHLLLVQAEPARWLVRQVLDDESGDRDWAVHAEVDLAASDEAGEAVVTVTAVAPV